MRYFPMFLDMRGRVALIAGGGEQAAQKARLIGRSEAEIRIMAPEINAELAAMVAAGRVVHVPEICDLSEVRAAAIVFAATGCVGLDGIVAAEAARAGAVANVVDRPALCTAITPAIIDRTPLVVAIGTEGAAPVLAQQVRMQVERDLPADIGEFAAALEEFRPQIGEFAPSPRDFWAWVFEGPPRAYWAAGDRAGALALVEAEIAAGAAPGRAVGRITLAGVPAEADLASLRLLRRLQDADLVVHGPEAPAALLEFVRRDAARGDVANAAGLLEAARAGEKVVVLGEFEGLSGELAGLGGEFELV